MKNKTAEAMEKLTEECQPIKVFQMNDCDWMAARTIEEAKAAYLKDYCGGLDEDEAIDEPSELDAVEMEHYKFHDDDDHEIVRTFREQLEMLIAKGTMFPVFFASTEY